EEELERALLLDTDVIGINNRNLEEGTVDVATTYELMPDVPAGKTVVAESGISTRAELEELERVGVDAVLIGSALMSAAEPEALARDLTGADEGTREHHLP
ncbi:MAG TPA: indole-3-glycerol phosphate synthase, partial [Solirubrobacterales bacterium]